MILSEVAPSFRFVFPQPNGDHPTSTVRREPRLEDAIEAAFRSHHYGINGSTVFDSNWNSLGMVRIRWPGPTIWLDNGDEKRKLFTVQLNPAGKSRATAGDMQWRGARFHAA